MSTRTAIKRKKDKVKYLIEVVQAQVKLNKPIVALEFIIRLSDHLIEYIDQALKLEEEMHKKIMVKAAQALEKDARSYQKVAKHAKGAKKKHEKVEEKEAESAAKELKKRAKKAHEYG